MPSVLGLFGAEAKNAAGYPQIPRAAREAVPMLGVAFLPGGANHFTACPTVPLRLPLDAHSAGSGFVAHDLGVALRGSPRLPRDLPMASIYRLGSGLWRAQIARRGVRKSQTFATKKAAELWAAREETAILDGTASRWPAKTLADALARYEREVTPTKGAKAFEAVVIRTTLRDYPDLCAMPLHAITAQDLAAWRDKRAAEVSGSTVVRYAALLRNVWTVAAREWGWCPEPSPWRSLKLPAHNPPRERIPSWREVRAVLRRLNYISGDPPRSMMQEVAYAWLISLRTGMRASEVRSITPATVDLAARVVTLPQHKTAHITGRARRVPITKQAARIIALCPSFTVSARSLDALFRKARDMAGLEGFTFHDGRALALTLLSRRVDVLTLARISGHRDLRILQAYYRESEAAIAARL